MPMLMDATTRAFLASTLPPPQQSDLDEVLDAASEVRFCHPTPSARAVLGDGFSLSLTSPEAIQALRQVLRVSDSGAHCMCFGDLSMECRRGETLLASISLHHGASMRWAERWKTDALFIEPRKVAVFLEDRGLAYFRQRLDIDEARRRDYHQAADRWQQAMPPFLRPFEEGVTQFVGSHEYIDEAWVVASGGTSASTETILALLHWNGSGNGQWSGFPAHEVVAEGLLRRVPLQVLAQVLATAALTPAQLDGAARLLGGWDFWKGRKDERGLFGEAIRDRLRAHLDGEKDRDKLQRFSSAWR